MKRCTEPLAWNIEPDSIVAQVDCPLFTTIPKELRYSIYEYALTESMVCQPGQTELSMATTMARHRRQQGLSQQRDIAKNLLSTCRAVYLETYLLPIILNPVQFPYFDTRTRFRPQAMLPWQFANIRALDITVQQVTLEGGDLFDFLFGPMGWHPEVRHKGVHVAPYVDLKDTTGGSRQSCGFTLLPTETKTERLQLTDALNQVRLPSGFQIPLSETRLQRARPLTHLTLRIPSSNWWTWTDDPSSTNSKHHHLGLDPALGDGSADVNRRPTSTRMIELSQQRRDGHCPLSRSFMARNSPGWAHIIGRLPDIKTLELVLETFGEKKSQLEKVVKCAKTWCFPIADSQFELAWDGKVEEMRWSRPAVEDYQLQGISRRPTPAQRAREFQLGHWYTRSTDFEVRTIRFARRRKAADSSDEDCKVH